VGGSFASPKSCVKRHTGIHKSTKKETGPSDFKGKSLAKQGWQKEKKVRGGTCQKGENPSANPISRQKARTPGKTRGRPPRSVFQKFKKEQQQQQGRERSGVKGSAWSVEAELRRRRGGAE